jgi:hypothetical protein
MEMIALLGPLLGTLSGTTMSFEVIILLLLFLLFSIATEALLTTS